MILKPDCAEQPLLVADTMMFATIGEPVALFAVNVPMLPEPDEGKPIAVLLLVHVIVAPGVVLVNVNGPATSPAHNAAGEEGTVISAPGLIVNCLVAVALPHSLVTVTETV